MVQGPTPVAFLTAEELPRLRDRRELVHQFLAEHGIDAIASLADDAVRIRLVALLADPELRTTFDGLVGVAGGVDPQTGRGPSGKTAGGVNANASKQELIKQARKLGVRGRSSMNKGELVDALRKASDRQTRQARERGRS
ncbi:MAG: Rho termination factor N-terminal domain-containing protein [Pseudonocardiaceae bacterium]